MWILITISLDCEKTLKNKKTLLLEYPRIILYNLTCVFNKYMLISKELRIYKENDKIFFNPKEKIIISANKDIGKTVKILSPSLKKTYSDSKVVTHPGIQFHENKDNDKYDISVQFTGRLPTNDYSGVIIRTYDYKFDNAFIVYNVIRDYQNIQMSHNYKILSSIHLNNINKMDNLYKNITLLRSMSNNLVIENVFNEPGDSSREIINTNFAEYCLENNDKINTDYRLMKIFEYNRNIIGKMSDKDYKELYLNLKGIVVDYRTNDHLKNPFYKETVKMFGFSN